MKFDLTYQQEDYLEEFLHKVSRSFALIIPCLEKPLDLMIATSYLLCRVADNIEDCWQSLDWKQARFGEFYQLLEQPSFAAKILTAWENENWSGLSPDEISLVSVEQGLMLWQIYGHLPDEATSIVCHWVLQLSQGMEQMLNPENLMTISRNNVKLLNTKLDYDRYCYFVAGTVGHLGTELAIEHYQFEAQTAEVLVAYSEHCGRALQKTNIIKDFGKDLNRGVCFIPDEWIQEAIGSPLALAGAPQIWQYKIMSDVMADLVGAVHYIVNTPCRAIGLRQFSIRALLTAYQTLLVASQQHKLLFTPAHNVKISRSVMLQCIEDAKLMANDNQLLLSYSQTLNNAIAGEYH
ncbi:squalene/phytoene synthase family protein [Chamaesiphon sp. OTE_75_metabat_556]|uniref:squalene/phytoene synthase family protein n=1 Tax=Chamaesiphon sp. OTE_75_metabat_556 TaxID=2964692 RepID=UPI00286CFC2E|nr:squalene/phytoene synthase family protein [Chamaesiphon sp. OTE_75_metabat_556]